MYNAIFVPIYSYGPVVHNSTSTYIILLADYTHMMQGHFGPVSFNQLIYHFILKFKDKKISMYTLQ